MKVLFYINVLGGGGAERVVSNLANQFVNSNHEVGVITSYKIANEYKLNNRVKRFLLEDNQDISSNVMVRNISRVIRLRNIIKKENADVLISFMAEPNFRAVLASVGLDTKVVISVRNDPNREYGGRLSRILAKTLLTKADGCVFQTKDAQDWFPVKLRKKSTIIYNQVNEAFFETTYSGERKDIVSVGRLTDQKNFGLLINAFSSISNKIDDDLYIYGEGELREVLQQQACHLNIEKRVFFPGNILDIPNAIKSKKVFVLSSNYEGMPNALMEALTLGVPSIATDCPCGGPRELIKDNENGLLVAVDDVEELSSKLLQLCLDKTKCDLLSDKSREMAKEYAPEIIFSKWEQYIGNVIDS